MSTLHTHWKRKRPAKTALAKAKAVPTPIVEKQTGGSIIGFWMLPSQNGYVKLKIVDSYAVKSEAGKKISKTNNNGHWLPVWGLVSASDDLKSYFPWVDTAIRNSVGLFSKDDMERTKAARHLQAIFISHGFSFAIKQQDTIWWCGSSRKQLTLFLQELVGQLSFNPKGLSIGSYDVDSEENEFTTLRLLKPNGSPDVALTMKAVMAAIFKKKGEEDDKGEKGFAETINGISNPTAIDIFRVGWKDPSEWRGLSPESLASAFEADGIIALHSRLDDNDKKRLESALNIAFQTARKLNVSPDDWGWSADQLKRLKGVSKPRVIESLTEATFRELLNATASNGDYRIGGLRRIGRIWVYDRSIPDRVSNSRFVVIRRPILQLDRDGYPIYRFRFRSRPDRNTTDMSHGGYIKFVDKPNFMSRLTGFFKDQIDLNVHVGCECPDFKYRWHWVLAQNNASHTPTGAGFDAQNRRPMVTNPNSLVCMCKHLVVAKDYLLLSAREHNRAVRELQKQRPLSKAEKPNEPETQKVDPEAEVTTVQ